MSETNGSTMTPIVVKNKTLIAIRQAKEVLENLESTKEEDDSPCPKLEAKIQYYRQKVAQLVIYYEDVYGTYRRGMENLIQ